jgi:hypothetical protein
MVIKASHPFAFRHTITFTCLPLSAGCFMKWSNAAHLILKYARLRNHGTIVNTVPSEQSNHIDHTE